jgi:hypothetical protein
MAPFQMDLMRLLLRALGISPCSSMAPSYRPSPTAPSSASTKPAAANGADPGRTRSPSSRPATAGTTVWVTTIAAVAVVAEPRCIAPL